MKSITELLSAIGEKAILKSESFRHFKALGFEGMIVDINSSEFIVGCHWELQEVNIPEKKRGNLSAYAGKRVEVVTTGIVGNGGARVKFQIREKK